MAKFKKGDRVRCVRRDSSDGMFYDVGQEVVVESCGKSTFDGENGGVFWISRWELATPQPIPDTVTIGGVEYVRKPEPEHVWAWGQWARVNGAQPRYEGEHVFIVGGLDEGFVPVTSQKESSDVRVEMISPKHLTYISTATIPE